MGLYILLLTILLWIDFHNIIINAFVNTYKLKLPIYIKMLCFLTLTFYTLKTSFFQKINGNIVKISKNKYILSYVIAGNYYKTILPLRRGPSPILQILDSNSNDITNDILPYSGLDNSFKHTLDLKPIDLGYEELIINMSNGECRTIKAQQSLSEYLNP